MKILGLSIIAVFVLWLTLSPLIYLYWYVIDGDARSRTHPKLRAAVLLGTWFAGCVVIAEGLEQVLFFIPASWGSVDPDGHWDSGRRQIGYFIGFWASVWLLYALERKRDLEKHNQELKQKLTTLQEDNP